jgi:hypothetical protein
VADKSSQLVINALTRAAATATAVPWHGSKAAPGLFPATAAGKQAAQRCRDEGYLSAATTGAELDSSGGTAVKVRAGAELCTITEKGLAYLFNQVSPRQVLEDMVRVLEEREGQFAQLLTAARSAQANLESLKANVQCVLEQVRAGERAAPAPPTNGDLKGLFHAFQGKSANGTGDSLERALLAHLTRWASSGSSGDCPLPDLFRHAQSTYPGLSIGQFHDALRYLDGKQEVSLHPWTGPLYVMPEPAYALLVGHVIAYYASVRS